jgi:nucleoside-diphosphate-sugar epimerase
VTDGEPVVFREFVSRMLETQGVTPPEGSLPPAVVRVAAPVSESLWRLVGRGRQPPITRFATWIASQECTIDISRAERDLGYAPVKTREEGLAELAAAADS